MPLYEYVCRECGNRYEAMRRMSQRAEAPPCKECGSEETALALSTSAFVGGGGSGGACSTRAWTGGG
ncbi:MAG: FmdB family zinc ribbon protein [Gemmatimonadota bacterium]